MKVNKLSFIKIILLLCSLLLLQTFVNCEEGCQSTGECIRCTEEEKDQEYCKETNYKQQYKCTDLGEPKTIYKSCTNKTQDIMSFLAFVIPMALISALSFYFIKKKNKDHQNVHKI
ncbi:jtb protein-related [Anaeramoeba flamelloides]|uniref:Jtb protein-related n=1 Tax=Anaeramoeba flamelloides TaxID=1746091 RepID=A0AAV8ACI8_9EUKA|nr:jtb protein-related [Anaeramoeba flamelloides]KAJ6252703.1 jtb protein-related [Anaeramoeba flamelloides]